MATERLAKSLCLPAAVNASNPMGVVGEGGVNFPVPELLGDVVDVHVPHQGDRREGVAGVVGDALACLLTDRGRSV